MKKRMNNKGLSLAELLVAVAIMAVLIGVLVPVLIGQVRKAQQVKVEKEASEFINAARLAYIAVVAEGNTPGPDSVKNRTVTSSPYYKNGTLYGNLTNWTVHNDVVAGASNGPFAYAFFENLSISYGKEWKSGSSSVPISANQPKMNPAGSMTNECIFQVFYTEDGSMVVEYSRNGYFVRFENSTLVDSIKIKDTTEKLFTQWK